MLNDHTWDTLFMPHGQCFLWQPGVLWLNVLSDIFITAAYYVISGALFYLLYKRHDVPFKWMFALFGAFIFACGTTHAMHVWTVWHPDYWAEGFVKAGTAALSFCTGLLFIPLLPKVMALRSPLELEQVNADLSTALAARQHAIETLQGSQAELIRRAEELTRQRHQLRQMASQLTTTEQRERRRLATELHDYLAQLLVVCRLKVSQAKNRLMDRSDAFLDDLNGSLDACLKYTRTLVSELCPTALYESGVVSALRQCSTQMEQHGLRVTVVTSTPEPTLNEDQAIVVYQTIRELLFNVLKHAKTDRAEVRLRLTLNNEVEAVVQDAGQGFDMASLADQSSTGRFGLFNIRERIEALGGRFDLRSSVGTGTIATFTLPASVTPQAPCVVEPPSAGGAAPLVKAMPGMIRVLLVDDHAMVRQGLRSVLDGYLDVEVLGEACNGEEAVNCVGALRPMVVVMDINMPKMDGIEATRLIKSRYPDVTVVGLSVNANAHNETAMLDAGAALLLTKEAAVEQLYAAIQQATRKSRGPAPYSL